MKKIFGKKKDKKDKKKKNKDSGNVADTHNSSNKHSLQNTHSNSYNSNNKSSSSNNHASNGYNNSNKNKNGIALQENALQTAGTLNTQKVLPTNNMNPSRSHDDISAADMMNKMNKMRAKGTKKRHSHIGATRHHSSLKKIPLSGNQPAPIKENQQLSNGDAGGASHHHNHHSGNKNKNKKHVTYSGNTMGGGGTMSGVSNRSGGGTMGALMTSSATTKRLEQLMASRPGKDAKGNRSRSVNVAKKKQQEMKYPKKRIPPVHNREPRRHSFHPDKEKEKGQKKHAQHLKDRRKTIDQAVKYKKVQYRVKNELFVLYDYYQPVRIIGSGAYAVVGEAINTVTGKKLAVKKNKGVFDHITDARRILREIKLLMHFDHQDIIQLVDVIPPEATEIDEFNDVYLIMPKMETTLAKVIRSKQKLTDRHFQFFMYQMLRGLQYMHSANVIHRDLKPENILINGADCNVKITDFGLARGVCKDRDIEKPTEYVVTRWYRSPEVMCSAGFYDEKVDIWSLGCIFAELILRRPLFPGQNYLDQLKIIFEVMGTPKDLTWIKTPEARRWVQKLKPHDGKPLKEVFLKASDGALELLGCMLKMDPAQRSSSMECLRHKYLKELHRKEDEVVCPPFDLSFEFEKSIKTKFGVRHMMYDALTEFKKSLPPQEAYPKVKRGTAKNGAKKQHRTKSKEKDEHKKN